MRRLAALVTCAWLATAATVCADEAQPGDQARFFRQQVAPVFERHCVRCHRGDDPKGGLNLEHRDRLLAGGESGTVLVPGEPDDSLLLDFVAGDEPLMPKQGEPLTEEQIATLRQWIAGGAVWPDDLVLADRSERWWSLGPISKPPLPDISAADAPRVRTPVDAFILAKLREHNLSMSPEADRRTLIRRLTYDLHGLPAAPEAIDAFVADRSPDAYERLVDRLLASPRYGERWARHWLDVVHYADTHGYDKDKRRPHAWPYRDYVIDSLNADKPYDRFLLEQLAGDVLFADDPRATVATGFIAAGPWDYVGHAELREGTVDKKITRVLDRDDMVTNTMSTFVSMTVHCARCHDHKFDPIPQRDYYSLQAVFAGVERADRPYADGKLVYAAAPTFMPIGSFMPPPGGEPRTVHLLSRGSVQSPIEEMSPGTLSCVSELSARFDLADGDDEGQRRAALARWIVDEQNPLTWRSIVNRVWHYHFGRGLVDSPNDFGRMGSEPTHPQLLDWLAADFRDGDLSLKRLHRLIVTSRVYRQSSAGDAKAATVDAGNRYLWRMHRRRLEAEELRDAVLAVSGQLHSKMHGPGYDLFEFVDDHSPHYYYDKHDPDAPESLRRTVYRFVVRSVPDPFMETLDCPDPSISVPVRNTTITALQALVLLNNKLMLRQAEHFARRLERGNDDRAAQIERAYQLALGRRPTGAETEQLAKFADRHGLASTCRAIFNLNEFLFID